MRRNPSITEKPAFDVIDDTIALLRRCPVATGLLYYIGALPFVLGFLYYWADMSAGAFAEYHLMNFSLFVTAAFIWCKFWQALFSTHLLAIAAGRTLPAWTWRKLLQVFTAQAAIQSIGLFLLPVCIVTLLFAPAACAFYQNAAALALDSSDNPQSIGALRREALTQALRWKRQNIHALLLLVFFGIIVFSNIRIMILILPMLLKSIFGIDTMFSRSQYSLSNTTLLAVSMGVTYLCVDPIFKTFYALRCFYGRSIATGNDLRIQIRNFAPGAAAVIALLLISAAPTGRAATSTPQGSAQSSAAAADSGKIDRSIKEVLGRPEFAWRSPRVDASGDEEKRNSVDQFFDTMGGWFKPIGHMFERLGRWWTRHMQGHNAAKQDSQSRGDSGGAGGLLAGGLQVFAWVFCAVALSALIVVCIRMWMRREVPESITVTPRQVTPDLTADDLTADQLPEDEWMRLAREMVEKRDLRLALRALYLASLAHLGNTGTISIARYKSNWDYQRELRRRRPGQAELIATFADMVGAFERAWYGMHDVTTDIFNFSRSNVERIRQS